MLKTVAILGHLFFGNKKKLLLGLGVILVSKAVSEVLVILENRKRLSESGLREARKTRSPRFQSSKHGHRHDIYQAPVIPNANLMKH